MGAILGGGQKSPPPVAPLPPPVPIPKEGDIDKRARDRSRREAALATGRDDTILTSGLGLTTKKANTAKTLLGGS